MKKITALLLGAFLVLNFTVQAETSAADKKWLDAVEKVIAKGETKVSTPSADRVSLLKEWAKKKGYSVAVTKTDLGYRLELSRSVAQK